MKSIQEKDDSEYATPYYLDQLFEKAINGYPDSTATFLITANGGSGMFHPAILSASRYFLYYFTGTDIIDKTKLTADYDFKIVTTLLRYIYTGMLPDYKKLDVDLLEFFAESRLASEWRLDYVKRVQLNFVKDNLQMIMDQDIRFIVDIDTLFGSFENCDVKSIAYEDIQRAIKAYIIKYWKEVPIFFLSTNLLDNISVGCVISMCFRLIECLLEEQEEKYDMKYALGRLNALEFRNITLVDFIKAYPVAAKYLFTNEQLSVLMGCNNICKQIYKKDQEPDIVILNSFGPKSNMTVFKSICDNALVREGYIKFIPNEAFNVGDTLVMYFIDTTLHYAVVQTIICNGDESKKALPNLQCLVKVDSLDKIGVTVYRIEQLDSDTKEEEKEETWEI